METLEEQKLPATGYPRCVRTIVVWKLMNGSLAENGINFVA